jgi:uncharacterized protein (DUF2384 family)
MPHAAIIRHDVLPESPLPFWGVLDALALAVLRDRTLARRLQKLERLELREIRDAVEEAVDRHRQAPPSPLAPLEVHQQLMAGLPGESILVSSSMLLDNIQEAEALFDLSPKTIKAKQGKPLDVAVGELALRIARVLTAAAEVLGSFDAARRYVRGKNYALGGAAPIDLIKTAEGERVVLNELQTQAESGPL